MTKMKNPYSFMGKGSQLFGLISLGYSNSNFLRDVIGKPKVLIFSDNAQCPHLLTNLLFQQEHLLQGNSQWPFLAAFCAGGCLVHPNALEHGTIGARVEVLLKDEVFPLDLWIIGQITAVAAAGIAGRIGSCCVAWWLLSIIWWGILKDIL
jgi:hypothetical protein